MVHTFTSTAGPPAPSPAATQPTAPKGLPVAAVDQERR